MPTYNKSIMTLANNGALPASIVTGYTNLAQQNGWTGRKKQVLSRFKNTVKASVYLLVETDTSMAADIAGGLGWGTPGQPCWRTDENRNTVAWDPLKWRDIDTKQASLSAKPKDLGERHYRSVNWVLLEHRATGRRCWFGAAHLSNGSNAGTDRATQAKVLVASIPTGAPILLGIDRNSLPTSDPAKIISLVLPLLTPDLPDSFLGNGRQAGTAAIDGLHGTVMIRNVSTCADTKATDHLLIRAAVTIH